MDLYDLYKHNVRIECDNGFTIEGYVHMFTSSEDNYPDPESISIGMYELFESDIKNVSILD